MAPKVMFFRMRLLSFSTRRVRSPPIGRGERLCGPAPLQEIAASRGDDGVSPIRLA
jgi:hypothetical protein